MRKPEQVWAVYKPNNGYVFIGTIARFRCDSINEFLDEGQDWAEMRKCGFSCKRFDLTLAGDYKTKLAK